MSDWDNYTPSFGESWVSWFIQDNKDAFAGAGLIGSGIGYACTTLGTALQTYFEGELVLGELSAVSADLLAVVGTAIGGAIGGITAPAAIAQAIRGHSVKSTLNNAK